MGVVQAAILSNPKSTLRPRFGGLEMVQPNLTVLEIAQGDFSLLSIDDDGRHHSFIISSLIKGIYSPYNFIVCNMNHYRDNLSHSILVDKCEIKR